jgi:hypothetical protein
VDYQPSPLAQQALRSAGGFGRDGPPDGLQITRARAKKLLIEVATTVTVYPDGRTEKDLPPGRADLAGIEARLKQHLRLRHPAMECGGR